jgi:hypothetical protein
MEYFVQSSIRLLIGVRDVALCASLVAHLALLNGCGPQYVRAPDSPMLILEGKGSVRVAMLDGEDMVDVGWIDAAELEGQTVVKYDWVNDE